MTTATSRHKDKDHQKRNYLAAKATIDRLKVETGCVDCGYNRHPAALHFDHIDPATKRRELGWHKDYARLTSKAKLARHLEHLRRYCEVRCANCHAIRSHREQHWRVGARLRAVPGTGAGHGYGTGYGTGQGTGQGTGTG